MPQMPRTILITGASSGIGAALAHLYAAPGTTLLLTGRDANRLQETVHACRTKGADVHFITADICGRDYIHQWIIDMDRRRPVNLVIANAGISGGLGHGFESAVQAQAIFDVNVGGVMNTIHPLIPRMQSRGAGQIAIMSSLAGFAPWPGAPAYAASKAAVRSYGLSLRTALAPCGIAVNVICPGFIDTPMTRVNPYYMPWLITRERAATIIRQGLAKNRAIIAFPWQTAFFARMIGMLPPGIQQMVLRHSPSKPAL